MGAINFSKSKYGNTIIMDSYTNPEIYENDELEGEEWVFKDFIDDVEDINSKISQNLDKYKAFLQGYDPIHIVVDIGYYESFEAYVDGYKNLSRCGGFDLKRDNYETDEDYKKAVIDEYVQYADDDWRDNYVDYICTDQDFDKLLDEYRRDLNIAFNQIDYELVKLGQDYGMSILDENGWVTKTHKITDKDVEIAKAKLDNQKTKEKSKDIDDDWER